MRRERKFTNRTQISVVGTGSGGCHIVNQLIQGGGAEANFVCLDYTDSEPLLSLTETNLPFLDGIQLLILVTTLGGTTGQHISSHITKAAHEKDIFILTLATLPASYEGNSRKNTAQRSLATIRAVTDAIIVLPLDNFMAMKSRSTSQTFLKAQRYICWAIKAICKLLLPGQININFSALQSVLRTDGPIFLGGDCASGTNRAIRAVQYATLSSSMNLSIDGADYLLLHIQASPKFYLWEFTEIITHIKQRIDINANLVFGTIIDPAMEDKICLTILATGFA